MKLSTMNKAESKLREVEGSLKEAIGEAARNRNLELEGKRNERRRSRRFKARSAGSKNKKARVSRGSVHSRSALMIVRRSTC